MFVMFNITNIIYTNMNTISPYNQQLGDFLEIVELCDIYQDCNSLKHNFEKCKRFINIISLSGYTALMILCHKGCVINHIKLILEYGANPNLHRDIEHAPLIKVFRNKEDNSAEVMKLLIDAGADTTFENDNTGILDHPIVSYTNAVKHMFLIKTGVEINKHIFSNNKKALYLLYLAKTKDFGCLDVEIVFYIISHLFI